MTRNRRNPRADRREVLSRIMRLVRAGNWITLDTETTGRELEDQVIEVAICDPLLPELPTRSWLIRPTIPIQEEATQLHGIRLEDLAECPTYAECWPEIEGAINNRKNVMYNADFDFHRLFKSARAHNMKGPRIWTGLCAMHWYAIYHGEPLGYDSYRYQSLENACQQMQIPIEGPLHRAATDACLTAKLLLKLAEIGEEETSSKAGRVQDGSE
jgi:DNA polymerase III subunit epsilon